jgi:hypothetical protein
MVALEPQNYGPVSPDLLIRIQKGAIESPETIPKLKKIIEQILSDSSK